MKKFIAGFNLLPICCLVLALSSCTKGFDELNTDKTRIDANNPVGASFDKLFTSAQYAGMQNTDGWANAYQLVHSLYFDAQAQFYACTQKGFFSDRNFMNGGWIDGSWSVFLKAATTLDDIAKRTGPLSPSSDPVAYSIANIWKVYIYMPMTDAYGPIPYSQVGNGESSVLYDSQEAIYTDFFKILTDATNVLSQNLDKKAFPTGDLVYDGDAAKWLKLGNSLRLRAAIRISKVNPTRAKTEGEAAIAAAGGLITASADNAKMKTNTGDNGNPLRTISGWGEFRMSASMESVLMGYQDPRTPKFFAVPKNGGPHKGIRNGLSVVQMAETYNNVDNNSNVATTWQDGIGAKDEPHILYVAAETWFNMAEAAVLGWNVGGLTAKQCYDNGIKASFAQWGLTEAQATAYSLSLNTPRAYGGAAPYAIGPLSTIPVLFGLTPAIQLEQIGTQKWLAFFPFQNGEAWAEFRRTGYPKLYPRLNNENTDASTAANSVKRLIFPPSEITVNKAGYESGVQLLGGPDKVSTKLWWNP